MVLISYLMQFFVNHIKSHQLLLNSQVWFMKHVGPVKMYCTGAQSKICMKKFVCYEVLAHLYQGMR